MNNVRGMDLSQKPMILTSLIQTSLYGPNMEESKISQSLFQKDSVTNANLEN